MSYTYDVPKAELSVDAVLFTIISTQLEVLLIRRRSPPFEGCWAIPGGFVDVASGESLDEAAARELEEETGLRASELYLEQLYTFGAPGRDPRGRVISVAYYALVRPDLHAQVQAGDDASDAAWSTVADLLDGGGSTRLAFDHAEILETAVARIRGKIDYVPRIAISLLPAAFTAAEFRRVHEIVKGVTFDASNFHKRFRRMVADETIVKTGERRKTGGAPAELYRIEQASDPQRQKRASGAGSSARDTRRSAS
jgi:8-oxo-dGTP diphosphatase